MPLCPYHCTIEECSGPSRRLRGDHLVLHPVPNTPFSKYIILTYIGKEEERDRYQLRALIYIHPDDGCEHLFDVIIYVTFNKLTFHSTD